MRRNVDSGDGRRIGSLGARPHDANEPVVGGDVEGFYRSPDDVTRCTRGSRVVQLHTQVVTERSST